MRLSRFRSTVSSIAASCALLSRSRDERRRVRRSRQVSRRVLGEDSPVTHGELAYLTPEAKARVEIDAALVAAGWAVQDRRAVNLHAARGVAVREFPLAPATASRTTCSTWTDRRSA